MKNETRQKIQKKTAKKLSKIYTICVFAGVLTASFIPDLSNSISSMSPILRETTRIGLVIFWIWLIYITFYRIIMEAYEKQDDMIADHTYLMHALHNLIDAHINTCYDKCKIEFGELYSDIFPDIFDMWQNGETFTNSDGEKYTITEWMYDNENKEWNMTLTKIKED